MRALSLVALATVVAATSASAASASATTQWDDTPPSAKTTLLRFEAPPQFAPDGTRTGLVIAGAIGQALGGALTGGWLVAASPQESRCQRYAVECPKIGSWLPLLAYTSTMMLSPVAASLHVGAYKRSLLFSGAIVATILTSRFVDPDLRKTGYVGLEGVLLGFVAPTAIGIVALATTPHAEDLAPHKGPIEQVAVLPVADSKHGVTGATVGVGGTF
jgi:hypothetical protein